MVAACGVLRSSRVLSIAAGVTLATLEGALPAGTVVVRAMPNTAALVGAGASAIAPGSNAGPDDLAWARAVLGAVGEVVDVPERLLDAVTGLSGSGPAYVFLMAEALIEGGVLAGLPRDVSVRLTTATLLGCGPPAGRVGRDARGPAGIGDLARGDHRRRSAGARGRRRAQRLHRGGGRGERAVPPAGRLSDRRGGPRHPSSGAPLSPGASAA